MSTFIGIYIINLKKTWEKLLLAARAIVAIENPADVCVISSRNTGQVDTLTSELCLLYTVIIDLPQGKIIVYNAHC